jgi:tetratricopeptide (TPR) repeat protein
MAEEEEKGSLDKPIDWLSGWQASFGRMRRRFGLPAAVLLALLAGGGFVWWNWEDIAKKPGVERLIERLSRRTIQTAPAGCLTIAVTHLEDDEGRKQEKQLLAGLEDFEGVETLTIDRMVAWPASGTERENRKKAEEEARGLLKQSGADVLVWGRVIKSTMRLYWTPSRDVSGAKVGNYQPQTETIALPEAFWDDLKQILGLLTQSRLAELTFGQEGHYVADRLARLIVQVRALAGSKEGVWDPETLAGVQFSLATALGFYGAQSGKNEPLIESAELYRRVLVAWTREHVPVDWAMTQNNLGNALATLGERESGTKRLEEAVAAYRAALEERTRERVPLDWARTQMNLGSALRQLGARESGTGTLQMAAEADREALKVYTRERVPLEWAKTQYGLGNALATLGGRESGTETLQQQAVGAYGEALKELTRERVPLEWATTQNNLGNALLTLGERESGTARLEEAVAAYRAALKEWTETATPYWHDIAQKNLDRANAMLAERQHKMRAH